MQGGLITQGGLIIQVVFNTGFTVYVTDQSLCECNCRPMYKQVNQSYLMCDYVNRSLTKSDQSDLVCLIM